MKYLNGKKINPMGYWKVKENVIEEARKYKIKSELHKKDQLLMVM